MRQQIERILESTLFASRWLMAPIYIGLSLALVGLVIVFTRELIHEAEGLLTMDPDQGILAILSLIDLSLAGNLLLIVIFSGYENFVSRIDKASAEDRPEWMGTVDFSALKMKLLASIIAISAVALLKQFMIMGEPGAMSREQLIFLIVIHLTFVVSGVLMAAMDWLSSRSSKH
ncbi:MAG: TIGR00645 family protein [Alphaproteobacteria bacterium]|nr:TIGR00645 family protein [Alphaproteobacteria bacterium]